VETDAGDEPKTGTEAHLAIDGETAARPGSVGPRSAVFIRRHQKAIATALLIAILGYGAALRLQTVSAYFGPDTSHGADVRNYYIGTARSFLAGRGWNADLETNYIPPPLQAAFMVAVWTLAPGTDTTTESTASSRAREPLSKRACACRS
jgi:hypothetical protein